MKIILALLIILFYSLAGISQDFSLNQGGTLQKGYFAEISYQDVQGKIILAAKINNEAYRFILDTGAPNVISKSLYYDLKPEILSNIPVTDQSGKTDSMLVVSIDSLALGGVLFQDIPTLVTEDQIFTTCFQVDGFIGSNMLRHSIVQFSSRDQTIKITDNKDMLPLNRRQSSKLFLTPNQSNPYVWIKLKDNKKANIQLLFDSGDDGFLDLALSHFMLFQKKSTFNDYSKGIGSHSIGIHGFAEDTVIFRSSTEEMKINRSEFRNVSFETTASNNSRMGSTLLKHGIVTVDYINKRFYFDPFHETVDLKKKRFPFAFSMVDEKLIIGIVWVDESKIAVGDQIIEINGVNYENSKPCDIIRSDFEFMGNEKISMILKDKNGVVKNIVLVK